MPTIEKHTVKILDLAAGKITRQTLDKTIRPLTATSAAQKWEADRAAMLSSTVKTNTRLSQLLSH